MPAYPKPEMIAPRLALISLIERIRFLPHRLADKTGELLMADRHNPPRGWRGTTSGGAPSGGASYRSAPSSGKSRQIFTVLAIMLALAGVVAGFLYLLRPSPTPYFIPVFI